MGTVARKRHKIRALRYRKLWGCRTKCSDSDYIGVETFLLLVDYE